MTNVEVVVTDSKGKRVPGLTKEDFQVLQDGVPQTITNFYAVTGGKRPARGRQDRLPVGAGAGHGEGRGARGAQGPVRPLHRQPEHPAAEPQSDVQTVEGVRDADRRQAGRGDGRHLQPIVEGAAQVHVRLVRDPGRARADRGGDGRRDDVRSESGRTPSSASTTRTSAAQAESIARQYAQSYRNDLEFTVDGIKTTVNGLAGIAGPQGARLRLGRSPGDRRPRALRHHPAGSSARPPTRSVSSNST